MSRFYQFLIVATATFLIHAFVAVSVPAMRFLKYVHAAEMLLEGKLQGERILDFSPFYLYLNVLLKKLQWPPSVLLWFHVVCIAISAGLLFLLFKRYFRFNIAIAGTTAFLLDRSLMIHAQIYEPEVLLLLLLVTATYFITLNTRRDALFGGLCFGLAIVTRPNFLPVLATIPIYYKLNTQDRTWLKKSALFLLPAFLALGGLWIRNTVVLGYFSPFVMNPGTTFFEGNNPNSRGTSVIYPPVLNQLSEQYRNRPDYHHQLYRDFATRVTGTNLKLAEINSFWSSKATNYLLDHPQKWVELLATKILHSFHSYAWHDLAVAYSMERVVRDRWMVSTPFAVVSGLALMGVLLLSSGWKRYLIFYALFFCQIFVMLAIYVSARQRVAILFLFVFFACAALESILLNRKRWWLLIVTAVLCVLLYVPTDLMHEEDHLWSNMHLSNRELSESYSLRNQAKLEASADRSARALAFAPWLLDSRRPANLRFEQGFTNAALRHSKSGAPAEWMDKALLMLSSGRTAEAEIIFQKLLESGYKLKRDDYQSSEILFYIGRCALKKGEILRAVNTLKHAIQRSPGDPSSLALLRAITDDPKYEKQLLRYFDPIDAAFFLGQAYMEFSKPLLAVKQFKYVTQLLPEFRKGFIYLAVALSDAQHYQESTQQYRKAISIQADPVFGEDQILRAFQQVARRHPTALNYYSYGVVLRQFGHFQEALAEQQKATALEPSNQEIQREIRTIQRVINR